MYLKNINLLHVQDAQNNYIYFKLKLKMTLHFLTLKTGNAAVSFLGNYGTVLPPVQWIPCLFLRDVVAMAWG